MTNEAKDAWGRKLWSLLLFLASALVLYVAYRLQLLALTVHY